MECCKRNTPFNLFRPVSLADILCQQISGEDVGVELCHHRQLVGCVAGGVAIHHNVIGIKGIFGGRIGLGIIGKGDVIITVGAVDKFCRDSKGDIGYRACGI